MFSTSSTPTSTTYWGEPSSPREQNSGRVRRYSESASYYLVGVESNPGPGKVAGRKKPAKPKSGKQVVPMRGSQRAWVASAARQASGRTNVVGHQDRVETDNFSKYLACLNNPFDNGPARSGVDCAIPTSVASLYARSFVQCTSGGYVSLIAHPRCSNPLYSTGTAGAPYNYGVQIGSFPQSAGAQAIFTKGRVISAGIRIRSAQPSTADQGMISVVMMPGESINEVQNQVPNLAPGNTFNFGYNEIAGHPNASVYPFRRGCTVMWRPQDPNSFIFNQSIISLANITDSIDTAQSIPYFAIGVNGAAASAIFELEYVVHLECVIGSTYAGVVESASTIRAIPSYAAMNAVKQLHGPALNKSSFPGSVGGIVENRDTPFGGPGGTSSKSKSGFDWGKLATDVLSFATSVLPAIL